MKKLPGLICCVRGSRSKNRVLNSCTVKKPTLTGWKVGVCDRSLLSIRKREKSFATLIPGKSQLLFPPANNSYLHKGGQCIHGPCRNVSIFSTLRGMRKGHASYTMHLAKFDIVPQYIKNQRAA
ncbi:hypothetical protein MRB53_003075 [Persea americana]|uniref:Uncharacterized protein n=1 Tax=Persea americana TaxID=3435 RepID=A0ACC2MW67_PERAE|nr:hypothetical protein MRB53_003075 [Persea americana]